ncbi:MAG: hypothetical protein ABUK03_01515 [Dehalococcoidales bacterium]
MAAKRRHKGRELSRSKRKKEGRRQVATPQGPPVASAIPQPATPQPAAPVVAAVPVETAPPLTRPAPDGGGAASLMAELRRVGLFALIALAILVVLAFTLG